MYMFTLCTGILNGIDSHLRIPTKRSIICILSGIYGVGLCFYLVHAECTRSSSIIAYAKMSFCSYTLRLQPTVFQMHVLLPLYRYVQKNMFKVKIWSGQIRLNESGITE